MSTHLATDIIIFYFRDISEITYTSGINDTFPRSYFD